MHTQAYIFIDETSKLHSFKRNKLSENFYFSMFDVLHTPLSPLQLAPCLFISSTFVIKDATYTQ